MFYADFVRPAKSYRLPDEKEQKALADLVWAHFAKARARREELLANPGEVDRILREGAEKARRVIEPTLRKARAAVGLERI